MPPSADPIKVKEEISHNWSNPVTSENNESENVGEDHYPGHEKSSTSKGMTERGGHNDSMPETSIPLTARLAPPKACMHTIRNHYYMDGRINEEQLSIETGTFRLMNSHSKDTNATNLLSDSNETTSRARITLTNEQEIARVMLRNIFKERLTTI